MNRSFQRVAYLFFVAFGLVYLSADFMIHQGNSSSETLVTIYETFDMPFFFCAGMYLISAAHQQLKKRLDSPFITPVFWLLGIAWTVLLIYLNLGFQSFL